MGMWAVCAVMLQGVSEALYTIIIRVKHSGGGCLFATSEADVQWWYIQFYILDSTLDTLQALKASQWNTWTQMKVIFFLVGHEKSPRIRYHRTQGKGIEGGRNKNSNIIKKELFPFSMLSCLNEFLSSFCFIHSSPSSLNGSVHSCGTKRELAAGK